MKPDTMADVVAWKIYRAAWLVVAWCLLAIFWFAAGEATWEFLREIFSKLAS